MLNKSIISRWLPTVGLPICRMKSKDNFMYKLFKLRFLEFKPDPVEMINDGTNRKSDSLPCVMNNYIVGYNK